MLLIFIIPGDIYLNYTALSYALIVPGTRDKLQRSSVGARKYCQLSRPTTVQFITLSAHLCRAKLMITRFDDRYATAKFSRSPEFGENFQREVPLFLDIHVPEFSYSIAQDRLKQLPCRKPARFFVLPF